jgi:hypothetical protein
MWYVLMGLWMFGLIATWILAGFVLVGWSVAWRKREPDIDEKARLSDRMWLGLVLTVIALQLYHLFLPIDALALALWILVGLVGLAINRRVLADIAKPRLSVRAAILIAIFGLIVANHCITRSFFIDGYHYTAIEFIRDRSIVPGLANLEGRLGFNGSSFLLQALWLQGPWHDDYLGVVNGFLAFALGGLALRRIVGHVAEQPSHTAADYATMLSLVPIAFLLGRERHILPINGVSPDATCVLVLLAMVPQLLRLLAADSPEDFLRTARKSLLPLAGLLALAVSIKVSALVFAFALGAALVWQLIRLRLRPREIARLAIWPALLSGILIATWLVRGILTSGYPVYPSGALPVAVAWRVPQERVDWMGHAITELARVGFASESGRQAWIDRYSSVWLAPLGIPLLVTLAAIASLYLVRGRPARRPPNVRPALLISAAWTATFAYWAWLGPDPRFLFGTTWVLLIAWLATAAMASDGSSPTLAPRAILACAVIAWAGERVAAGSWGQGKPAMSVIAASLLRPPASASGRFWFENAHLEQRRTLSGLRVGFLLGGGVGELPPETITMEEPGWKFLNRREFGILGSGYVLESGDPRWRAELEREARVASRLWSGTPK